MMAGQKGQAMTDFDSMTVKQRMQYELNHTSYDKQRYVVADYKRGQNAILIALGILCSLVCFIEPLLI